MRQAPSDSRCSGTRNRAAQTCKAARSGTSPLAVPTSSNPYGAYEWGGAACSRSTEKQTDNKPHEHVHNVNGLGFRFPGPNSQYFKHNRWLASFHHCVDPYRSAKDLHSLRFNANEMCVFWDFNVRKEKWPPTQSTTSHNSCTYSPPGLTPLGPA